MPSVLSRISASQLLVGLAVGVGIRYLLAKRKSSLEAVRDEDAVKASEVQNVAAAGKANARVEAAEDERDQARRELEALRAKKKDAPKGAGELEALRKERDEMDALRKEAMRQVDTLENQQVALRQQAERFASERDAAVAQFEVAQRMVTSLEEEQASMEKELRASKQKRKDSMKTLSRSLTDIGTTLNTAETSWAPWKEINSVKEQLSNMQREAKNEEELVRGG